MDRIPVMCGYRCVELAGPARVQQLAKAPNAQMIRRHSDRKLVEVQLHEAGDDHARPRRKGNPLRYSHNSETRDNVQNVWALKRIPNEARPVFTEVLTSCRAA